MNNIFINFIGERNHTFIKIAGKGLVFVERLMGKESHFWKKRHIEKINNTRCGLGEGAFNYQSGPECAYILACPRQCSGNSQILNSDILIRHTYNDGVSDEEGLLDLSVDVRISSRGGLVTIIQVS